MLQVIDLYTPGTPVRRLNELEAERSTLTERLKGLQSQAGAGSWRQISMERIGHRIATSAASTRLRQQRHRG